MRRDRVWLHRSRWRGLALVYGEAGQTDHPGRGGRPHYRTDRRRQAHYAPRPEPEGARRAQHVIVPYKVLQTEKRVQGHGSQPLF
ncbi:MAG TPA: hypothetical protein PK775_09400, partial [Rectinema sp.]|nr:hypothetical protein [Rectinema sp.]